MARQHKVAAVVMKIKVIFCSLACGVENFSLRYVAKMGLFAPIHSALSHTEKFLFIFNILVLYFLPTTVQNYQLRRH